MFKRKPETVLVTQVFVDGRLVDTVSKVIQPGPDWFRRVFLIIIIPLGLWAMTMREMF